MTILFIRHGETPLNVARVLQPADTPLSERGHRQARALAQRLRELALSALVSSDMPRARQTADAIAAATGLAIEFTPLLQERNFGDLRGRAYDSLDFDPLAMEDAPPHGESIPAFEARVAQAFEHTVRRRAELPGTLAIVTHGLVIKALLKNHLRTGPGQVIPLRIANTSVTVVGRDAPHLVELLDCTSHLAAEVAEDSRSLSGG